MGTSLRAAWPTLAQHLCRPYSRQPFVPQRNRQPNVTLDRPLHRRHVWPVDRSFRRGFGEAYYHCKHGFLLDDLVEGLAANRLNDLRCSTAYGVASVRVSSLRATPTRRSPKSRAIIRNGSGIYLLCYIDLDPKCKQRYAFHIESVRAQVNPGVARQR